MTYLTISNINVAANQVNPTGTFIHARKWDASVEDFEGAKPAIYLFPISTTIQDEKFNISTHKVIMAFCDQDAPDSTDIEREYIINDMDVLSNAFLLALNDITDGAITSVSKECFYRQFGGIFTGVYLYFTITDTNIICQPQNQS